MSKYTIRYKGHRIKIGGGKLVFNTTYNTSTGTTDPSETTDPMLSASVQLTKNGTTSISISTSPSSISTFAYYEYYVNNSSNVKTTTSNLLITDVLKSTFNLNGNTAYTLYVRAVSSQGNRTSYKSTTFTTPADATTVDSITTYTPVVYNSNGTVYWDIFDNDSSVVAYYYVDNNTSNMKTTTYDAMLSVDDITDEFNLDPGSHTLYVKLYRNGSYSNASSPVTFTVAAPSTYDPSKAVNWDIHTFHDIGEIYQSLHKGDKVTFVIRHGERDASNSSNDQPITPRGQVALLCAARTKLTGNSDFESGITTSDFKLMGSSALRTCHTAVLLARGRGCDTDSILGQNTIDYCKNTDQNTQMKYFQDNDNLVKTSDSLLTESSNWPSNSGWPGVARGAYETDYTSYLNTYITKILNESTASINIFGSHDYNMIPFIITVARQGKTNTDEFLVPDLKFYEGEQHWIAYAGGVAIIQRSGDTTHEHLELVPIKTLTNIGGTSTDGSKDYSDGVVLMRKGVTSNKLTNDAYKPNSGYTYAYLVNGQIQRDITTYTDTLMPYDFDSSSSDSDTTTETKPSSYQRVAQTSTYSSLSTTDFNDAQTIYQKVNVAGGDRLIIMTRHTIRNSDSGKQSGALFATSSSEYINGYDGATLISNNIYKLQGAPFSNPDSDAYYSTNVKRCVETSYMIGKLRGKSSMSNMGTTSNLQTLGSNWESDLEVNHSGDGYVDNSKETALGSSLHPQASKQNYGKDSSQGSISSIEAVKQVPGPHTYFNDGFWSGSCSWPDVQNYYKNNTSKCKQICEKTINWLASDSHGHPFTYLTAHDLSILPYVCYATDNGNMFSSWNNDYSSNPTGWIYYCAGVAVIVHSNGNWEIYPVRISERGKFT